MENKLLGQYYNERIKEEGNWMYEDLDDETVKFLEKNLGHSVGFSAWKLNKAFSEVGQAFTECAQKLMRFKKVRSLRTLKSSRRLR